jgi:hypothetical protein
MKYQTGWININISGGYVMDHGLIHKTNADAKAVVGSVPCCTMQIEWPLNEENWVPRWKLKEEQVPMVQSTPNISDGSTASYYELPEGAKELQELISYRDMNAQIGEIFRSCYRYGIASHSDKLRDAKKIKFYIDAEIKRLENSVSKIGS